MSNGRKEKLLKVAPHFFEKLYENVTKIHFILVGSERFTL